MQLDNDLFNGVYNKKILVLGDVMIDEYIYGNVNRISPEAPIPVVEVKSSRIVLGGAANVANNIASLGAQVSLIGLVGNDNYGEILKMELSNKGIDNTYIVVSDEVPTTLKTRIIAGNQQIVRIDREERKNLDEKIQEKIIRDVKEVLQHFNALVISDYAKGFVTHRLSQELILLARKMDIPVIVDPKGTNYLKYANATVITPNMKEVEVYLNKRVEGDEEVLAAAEQLKRELSLDAVLVTRSSEGMTLYKGKDDFQHIKAIETEVYDVTGAGDTVVAVCSLGLAAGLTLDESAQLSNIAAGIVVRKHGTSTLTMQELQNQYEKINIKYRINV